MKKKDNWFHIALRWKGSVVPEVLPRSLLCGLFGVVIYILHLLNIKVSLQILGSIIPNIVLGLLLVFRTNTAYERFWEGRKAWGTLVVNIRNLSRLMQISTNCPEEEKQQREKSIKLLTAFAIATKLHLRSEAIEQDLDEILPEEDIVKLRSAIHAPLELTLWLGDYLQKQVQSDRIDTNYFVTMNSHLNALVEGLTSCERILKTPLPPAYCIYLKRLILIYCIGLPFHLVV